MHLICSEDISLPHSVSPAVKGAGGLTSLRLDEWVLLGTQGSVGSSFPELRAEKGPLHARLMG